VYRFRRDLFPGEIARRFLTQPYRKDTLHLADAARVWGEIARLEPFGNGNPEPIFATRVRVMTPPILTSAATCRMNVEQDGRIYQVKDFGGGILRTTLAQAIE
jgi:single-stranded DNA-specific DHH superfamily exonuclease